jgi:hypothetical protein
MRTRGLAAVVVVGVLLGISGPSHAASGELRVVVSGALGLPLGASADGKIMLRFGVNLPVSVVSEGASSTRVGLATFAQWCDAAPSVGFGHSATVMAFRLGGDVLVTVTAAGIAAASGIGGPEALKTTFSAMAPAATLSGTWTISDASSAGVANAGPSDAVVTFHYDTNPANTIPIDAFFWARNPWATRVTTSIPGRAEVTVTRNVPVEGPGDVAMGTLTKYDAFDLASELVELTAIDFGNVFVLYSCLPSLPCLMGGTGSVAHLSGRASEIIPFAPPDIVLRFHGSLP